MVAGTQWFAKCTRKRCWSRKFGGNKIAAHVYGTKHAVQKHHDVRIWSDNGDEEWSRHDTRQDPIPGISAPSP